MRLAKKLFVMNGKQQAVFYRPGKGEPSSDEQALDEVLVRKCYRRVRIGFDVMPEEAWLDLGANIGAFAVYCGLRGAKVVCYEPATDCFEILTKNTPATCYLAAVSASKLAQLPFATSNNPQNHYRGTIEVAKAPARYLRPGTVPNIWGGELSKQQFDGIKMDIEGSEGPLMDEDLLPRAEKLVMEYHTSRDSSLKNLARRLKWLRSRYHNVKYPKAYDDAIKAWIAKTGPETYRPRFDQLIFAWGLR